MNSKYLTSNCTIYNEIWIHHCKKQTLLLNFFIIVASINNSMSIKCCLCFSMKQTWGLLSDMSKMWGKAPLVSTCLTEKTNMTGQEFSHCAESDTRHHMIIILELLKNPSDMLSWRNLGFWWIILIVTQTWSRYTGSWVPWPDVPAWTDTPGPPQQIYEGAKTSSHGTYTAQIPAQDTSV